MATLTRALKQFGLVEGGLVASLRETVSLWLARADARRDLGEMSERMLLDVGLDPEEVKKEVAKPFWQA